MVHDRHGDHFVRRLLMPEEAVLFARSKRPVRFLAMRFAAKEAIVKALGTGLRARYLDTRYRHRTERMGSARRDLVAARPGTCATGSAPAKVTSR